MPNKSSPNSPKNAIPDRGLTPEFIAKWDMDLTTIKSLNKIANENKCLLVIKGGMATEAYLGGKLTRAHNDIDANFVNLAKLPEDQIFREVERIIKSEKINWELYSRSPEKIEYREKEDERPFFNRRRLELMIKSNQEIPPDVRKLVYTNGEEINVNVTEFYNFVAMKIKKLFEVQEGPYERETNKSDYTDLKRLLSLPECNKDKVVQSLSKAIKHSPDPDKEALKEYDFVVDLISQLEEVRK